MFGVIILQEMASRSLNFMQLRCTKTSGITTGSYFDKVQTYEEIMTNNDKVWMYKEIMMSDDNLEPNLVTSS